MNGVVSGVLLMLCWAISTASLMALFSVPLILAVILGLALTILGVLLIDITDIADWF